MLLKATGTICVILTGVVSIRASSWLRLWGCIELITLFLVGALHNRKASTTESLLKYFLVQTLGGILFLVYASTPAPALLMFRWGVLLKLGVFPWNMWVLPILRNQTWRGVWLISTLIKAPGLVAISQCHHPIISVCALTSAAQGAIAGVYFANMKKILAASSIMHTSWLRLLCKNWGWVWYLVLYTSLLAVGVYLLNKTCVSHHKHTINLPPLQGLALFIVMCSLAGVPPFAGFTLKWYLITDVGFAAGFVVVGLMVILRLGVYLYLAAGLRALMTAREKESNSCRVLAVWRVIILNRVGGLLLITT